MQSRIMFCLACLLLPLHVSNSPLTQVTESAKSTETLTYTTNGRLVFPANYREWVYLTSGVDRSYISGRIANSNSIFEQLSRLALPIRATSAGHGNGRSVCRLLSQE
jgi:hypothetical protein